MKELANYREVREKMSFIASYKHLEKLCGDMLNDRHGVSAYIDEMLNKPRGTYHVGGWDNDLKQLKHYRWVRNQIVHEPSCTEENMCHPKDVDWLNDFYNRIMNQTDPLALYRKAMRPKPTAKPIARSQNFEPTLSNYSYLTHTARPKKISGKAVGWMVFLFLTVLAILFFIVKCCIN